MRLTGFACLVLAGCSGAFAPVEADPNAVPSGQGEGSGTFLPDGDGGAPGPDAAPTADSGAGGRDADTADATIPPDGGDAGTSSPVVTKWTGVTSPSPNALVGLGGWSTQVVISAKAGDILFTPGGGAFTLVTPDSATHNAVWEAPSGDIVAVGDSVLLGPTYAQSRNFMVTHPSDNALHALTGRGAADVWAAGEDGSMLHSTNAGRTWSSVSTGTTNTLFGLSTAGNSIFAVGESGTILTSLDNGATWAHEATGATARTLYGVWASSPVDAWAVGEHGVILHRTTTGWTAATSGTTQDLNAVWGTSDHNVYVVGDSGTILHGGAGGWTAMTNPARFSLNAIWGSGPTDVWAVGDVGTILHGQ